MSLDVQKRGLACGSHVGSAAVDALTTEVESPHLRHRVREVCASFPQTYFRDVDRHQGAPEEFAAALRAAGWANALVPLTEGGTGLSLVQACSIVEEIGVQGAPAAGLIQEICNHRLLVTHGCGARIEEYARQVIGNELRAPAIAFQSGPADAMSITAGCPHGVRVNGRSARVSRAQSSDVLLLLATASLGTPVQDADKASSLYLADLRATIGRGLTIHPSRSLEDHDSSDIVARNLRLPTAWRIGAEGEGARYMTERRHAEILLSAAAAIGDALWFLRHAYDPVAVDCARELIDWQYPQTSSPYMNTVASIEVARLMHAGAAHRYDQGKSCEAEAKTALAFALDATRGAAEYCLGMGRNSDPGSQEDVNRKLRDTRRHHVVPFLAPSILSYIAEQVLGLARPH